MSAAEAAAAAAAKDYDGAIKLYTKLIDGAGDADKADLLAARAGLFSKLGRDSEAMADAKTAVDQDPKNSKTLHVLAHLQFKAKDFAAARVSFETLKVLEPRKRVYSQWVDMCRVQLGEELAPSKGAGVESLGTRSGPAGSSRPVVLDKGPTSVRADDPEAAKYWRGMPAATAHAQQSRYRHQWFQTETRVEVAVLAKRLLPEQVQVDLEPRHMRVQVQPGADDGTDEVFDWDVELADEVDPGASRWAVLSTKIEVVLAKTRPGTWPALETSEAARDRRRGAQAEASEAGSSSPALAPAGGANLYPYAGKRVDWDKIEANVAKEEAEEEVEGDAGVMSFFQKLYQEGDDDFKRAMMKSYVESGGTELSTNWDEVERKDFKAAREDKAV